MTAVVAACSYRVRSGPIRVRRDRVNGIYIIEPRLGWLGACAPTPGGGFRRIDVRLQQLRRAVSTPREWLVTAALGLLAFVCVRGDRRALEPLAAPGGGEVDPSTAAYRSAPRFLDGASLDGNTDEAVARLRARVEARDAWRLLIVLVSITPLVVACAAGFGLP